MNGAHPALVFPLCIAVRVLACTSVAAHISCFLFFFVAIRYYGILFAFINSFEARKHLYCLIKYCFYSNSITRIKEPIEKWIFGLFNRAEFT